MGGNKLGNAYESLPPPPLTRAKQTENSYTPRPRERRSRKDPNPKNGPPIESGSGQLIIGTQMAIRKVVTAPFVENSKIKQSVITYVMIMAK
jgi:hypothetical protein